MPGAASVPRDHHGREHRAHADGASGEVRQMKKMKPLNRIVFCVAFLEWGGNAVGTLASLWATVVLLGGFCSLLSPKDFWFSTVMIFVEATRVFIRNDALVSQWLFGSTRAFRRQDFSFRPMLKKQMRGNLIALIIGMFISGVPAFRPEIVTSIIKVALLVIISQILSRLQGGKVANFLLIFLGVAAYCGGTYGFYKTIAALRPRVKGVKIFGLITAWEVGTMILAGLAFLIRYMCTCLQKTGGLGLIKVITALALACLPLFEAILASYYRYVSRSIGVVLLILSTPKKPLPPFVERHFFQLIDAILPILFFWSVMFPLPGISLKLSFYMLFSAIAAVLIGNLQIPVAFLQVLLSILRLCSLLGHHHHDYHPLPDGASPNLVPSIVVFFMLELCQGLSYTVAITLGLISLPCRKSLVHKLGFTQEWGAKAVNLYYHQAYQARTERGLFPSEKYTPSLTSFAIESLGSTSSEIQVVGLRVLHHFLEEWDSESKKELITEITYTHKKAVPGLIDLLGSTVARHQDIRLLAAEITKELSGSLKISDYPGMLKQISSLLDAEKRQDSMPNRVSENNKKNFSLGLSILEKLACDPDNCIDISKYSTNIITKITGIISCLTDEKNSGEKKKQQKIYDSALNFVRRLAIQGKKIGARFRKELSENPFFLEHILNLESCQQETWEPVMDIIAMLALDEAARQEIGGTQSIIPKLIHAFLMPDDRQLRMAGGEALANLTIMSTDNCWAILLADPEHNLIKNLINMLEDEDYICVAANVLHNLCANSRDKLMDIDFGANQHLESALPKVMQIIRTKEGKPLEAALCVASQIGYVIPGYFSHMLKQDADAAAELVEKLVDTLRSNRKPCLGYPRIRRVLIEMIISIVDLCPGTGYTEIFGEKGAKEALDMVKGTPSRLEKYRVFVNGKGVVAESVPMRDLVDKVKRLIYQATPAPGA